MLGKLLKYDFRSMWKQFAINWPAALALALVNRFTLTLPERSSALGNIIAGIAGLVYAAILIAMCVIAVIFVIQRFFKGLLGDEGYLMNTLPVKTWQLIVSKLLCASVATIVSVLVAILSILLLAPIDGMDYIDIFRETVRVVSAAHLPEPPPSGLPDRLWSSVPGRLASCFALPVDSPGGLRTLCRQPGRVVSASPWPWTEGASAARPCCLWDPSARQCMRGVWSRAARVSRGVLGRRPPARPRRGAIRPPSGQRARRTRRHCGLPGCIPQAHGP